MCACNRHILVLRNCICYVAYSKRDQDTVAREHVVQFSEHSLLVQNMEAEM